MCIKTAVQMKGNLKVIHFELRFVILDWPVSQCLLAFCVTGSHHLGILWLLSGALSVSLAGSLSLWLSLYLFLFLNMLEQMSREQVFYNLYKTATVLIVLTTPARIPRTNWIDCKWHQAGISFRNLFSTIFQRPQSMEADYLC